MGAIENTVTSNEMNVALNQEFIANFKGEYDRLAEVLGVFAPEVMRAGQVLEQVRITGELNDAADSEGGSSSGTAYVEGDLVALSKYKTEKTAVGTVEVVPYRKLTTAQAILKSGYDVAMLRTDRKMLSNVRVATLRRFFDFLSKGTGTLAPGVQADTLQAALAYADAALEDSLEANGDQSEAFLHFVNRQDVARHLADSEVTTQSLYGMTYIKSFLGVDNLFITSQVPAGTVYVTMAENVHVFSLDFSSLSDAGLFYETESSGLIGVAHTPAHDRVSAETHVINGMLLFPEVTDYIVRATIGAAPAAARAVGEPLEGMAAEESLEGMAVEKPLEDMTVEELKAYAEANGIALASKAPKADILAAIKAAS